MPPTFQSSNTMIHYEARRGEGGHELDDWLRADEEIAKKKARTIAA
jgi:hypothetical protein